MSLMHGRKTMTGSGIGSLENHKGVLDFCAKHNITSDVEVIEASQLDYAFEQLKGSNKDAIRYVIDVKKSLENKDFLAKI